MGILDSIKKMTRPYDDDEDDFRDFTPPTSTAQTTPKSPAQARGDYAGFETQRDTSKVVKLHATTQLSVVLVKPERFEGGVEVADKLRERCTVVLNLEQTNKEIARRVLDFVSGAAYAQDGKVKKIAVNTYIITPYNVDFVGDLIDELENNGLYF
jgi:cell division inhibitor SepF